MQKFSIQSSLVYRRRYGIAIGMTLALLAGLLYMAWLFVPGGLTYHEKDSVTTSATILSQLTSLNWVIDAPYHAFQWLVLQIAGVSLASIKLPSIILGLATAFLIFTLLRQWFRSNVAILTSIIMLATGQFVLIAQSGTPYIMMILWPALLLVLGCAFIRAKTAAKRYLIGLTLGVALGLSFYTPLMIYFYIAVAISLISHPAQRLRIRRFPKIYLPLPLLAALIVALPLVLASIKNPSLLLNLAGVSWPLPSILQNFMTVTMQYFNVVSPTAGRFMAPMFSIGTLALILIGVVQMIRHKHSLRAHLFMPWLALLTLPILFNTDQASVVFIPLVILAATGLSFIISNWYRLFPNNPYARLAGLVPLVIFISALTFAGVERFMYGYRYDQEVVGQYSKDVPLLHRELKDHSTTTAVLVVPTNERAFYTQMMAINSERYPSVQSFRVTSTPPSNIASGETIIVANELHTQASNNYSQAQLHSMLVNSRSSDAARYYLYKNPS